MALIRLVSVARRWSCCIPLFAVMLITGAAFGSADALFAADAASEGYSDSATFSKQVQAIAKPGLAAVISLAKSPGGREVWLITVGRGETDRKPAVLIVGNVEAAHLVGSELALRMARQLIEKADDEPIQALLERHTFYFIPRPNPDGSEAFFRAPRLQRAGNDTRTDDDRDHIIGEDPGDDLNRDGLITMMRVADPAGKHIAHPEDARVMIEADAKKNETGQYSLYVEGKDDDHDEQFNEDGAGGISFNRNWTFKYPYFKPAAGPHQVSEPETRAVADFAFGHPNIAAVFCFSLEDNLMHPWKPADNQGRIKTAVQKEDAAYVDYIAEQYRKIHPGKDAPPSPGGEGSFSQWAYFHYGRWSLAARGWWVPKVSLAVAGTATESDAKKDDTEQKRLAVAETATESDTKIDDAEQKRLAVAGTATESDIKTNDDKPKAEDKKADGKKPAESRGAEQVNALRWFEREKIEGFVPWKAIEHADFPNKTVEVGGFKPFVLLNPPATELDALAERHSQFMIEFLKLMPKLDLAEVKVEPLSAGVYRISCQVLNTGYLPTMSEMGQINGAAYPLQIELQLPEKTVFLKGTPRAEVNRLAGRGGKAEAMWLVRTAEGKPASGKIVVYAPAVGRAEAAVELKLTN
ncbi:MAG: M14 family metallopeptidase [Pirellulales bacterium]